MMTAIIKNQFASFLIHPDYRFPGRIVTQFGDQFYFARDIGYPERGGFTTLESDWVTGPDRIAFYKIRAEAARYITLFWKNRISGSARTDG